MKSLIRLTILVCLWIALTPTQGWADKHFGRAAERELTELWGPGVVQQQTGGMMAQMAGFLRQMGQLLRRQDLTPEQTQKFPPLLEQMASLLDQMRDLTLRERPPREQMQLMGSLILNPA